METRNHTTVVNFFLLGISSHSKDQPFIFALLLTMYLVCLMGNSLMIALIFTDHHLHTPMYFFLSNLSVVDLSYTSVTVPKMLINLLSEKKIISFPECITQLYFFSAFGLTEMFLLAVMAYDRYVAICSPLHYTLVMSRRVCSCLVAGCWGIAYLNCLLHAMFISRMSFCGPNTIHYFFCDITSLLKLSCSDTSTYVLALFIEASVIGLGPFLCILISYIRIIGTILKIHSAEGRHKAFSTCSSHLTVVSLFYGTILFNYFCPSLAYSLERDIVITIMYTVMTPMLNPLIYSLRNKEVKGALRRMRTRRKCFQIT
ncbi:olfactory receptor 1361-like [Rhinatrema bivittatum]|uniref:olfactory receptor 1361-like n=1 Tax=Rhinatrema bivittatum TaxID=194408 RepID=UPI00112E1F7F|nr:olfactory receptor 1361-like [Rhinatrema bivittatum]